MNDMIKESEQFQQLLKQPRTKTQQQSVYAAEEELDDGRQFYSYKDAQAWLDGLRETWWWERWYWRIPGAELLQYNTKNHRMSATGTAMAWWDDADNYGRIVAKKIGLNEVTLIHELAHIVAQVLHDSKAHDPEWARDYANLTYLALGPIAWMRLADTFDRHSVNYDPHRKVYDRT